MSEPSLSVACRDSPLSGRGSLLAGWVEIAKGRDMGLIGKKVVCPCGQVGIVTSTPRLDAEPCVVRHGHGREHKVFDFWSPTDELLINDDGYYQQAEAWNS